MTEAQEYLERIEQQEKHIARMKDKALLFRSKATGTTQALDASGASGGGKADRQSGWIDAALDIEADIEKQESALRRMVDEAFELLHLIRDKRFYSVLRLRYLEYMTLEQIATEMDYTYRNTCYIHGRALQVFGRLLEDRRRERAEGKQT